MKIFLKPKMLTHVSSNDANMVFLSFLVTREHIQEYVEEFNKQSSGSRINVEEGRAKIVLR